MRISKSVMAVGGALVAAVAIGFTNPKAVHAVTAALVQVTNTTSNPVVNGEVTLNAAQIVQLYCASAELKCMQMLPGGQLSPDEYSVPAGRMLVITDVDILASKDTGNDSFGIQQTQGNCSSCTLSEPPLYYSVAADGTTHHFSLQRGIVFASYDGFTAYGSDNTTGYLYGYLTSN